VGSLLRGQRGGDTVTCKKCGRPIRSARAARVGYGWRCYARVLRAARVLLASRNDAAWRAADLLIDGAAVRLRGRVFQVVGSSGRQVYLTHPSACNCAAGLHGKLCYHRVAVSILAS
jgi:hypothetical protein